MLITETLDSGYTGISAGVSTGSGGGENITPVVAGNVITWFIPALAAGGTFQAVFTATVVAAPTDLGLSLDIHSECDNGGCLQDAATFHTYASALAIFDKENDRAQATIGEELTSTITATLFGNYVYTNVVVTDILPTGLGYVAAALTVRQDVDGDSGGPTVTVHSPDVAPTPGNSGTIQWNLGNLQGQVQITAVITSFVQNIGTNVDGQVRTNQAYLTYLDDGQPYQFTDSDTVTVIEPELNIAKGHSAGGNAVRAGDLITYTVTVSHTSASSTTAYDVKIVDQIPDKFTLVPNSLQVSPPPASTFTTGQRISVTYASIAPISPTIVITYVVSIDGDAEPSSLLTNTAVVSYTSLPGPNPNERDGSGGINDYRDETQATVRTGDVTIAKVLWDDRDYTIGEAITYTIYITVPTGLTRLNPAITDTIPAGLRYISPTSFLSLTTSPPFSLPGYTIGQVPAGGGDGSGGSTVTLAFDGDIVNPTGAPATILWTMRLVVADVATSNHGDEKPNTATVAYRNADDSPQVTTTVPVTVTLVEPQLVVEKSVVPGNAQPGDVAAYEILLYHHTTSTVPAYNVALTDVIPAGLNYISNSWQQYAGPPAFLVDDDNLPQLLARWTVIPTTVTALNPIRLRYNVVVPPETQPGALFTNIVSTTWTSLLDDPYGDTRDSSGGVDDYITSDSAQLTVSEVGINKTGPLTVTAGSVITYVLTVANSGPFTAVQTIVTDTMPFQVDTTGATYQIGGGGGTGSCTITPVPDGDLVQCVIGNIPAGVSATILVTATVDPDTPHGADLTNRAEFTIQSSDGSQTNNTATFETEVYAEADLALNKTGPITATAGQLITYTLVLTNNGPSTSRDVDVKDFLPAGLTFVEGSASQGGCVAGICQLNDLSPGQVVTMVITASVGADVRGLITNTAQSFSDTADSDPSNNVAQWPTTVSGLTALQVDKVDLTDPVYAGDTYFYEIVVTNTGPSLAENVVVTDTLPGEVSYEGASPECSVSGSVVTCVAGDLAVGESRDYLIHVRVNSGVVSGTVGTNSVWVTTSTPIDVGQSRLNDTETTTYLQPVGEPTDLALTKVADPAVVWAGSGLVTYTLVVTNLGPAPASAVQVVDAYPRDFQLVSAVTSKDTSEALCASGGVCDLGEMSINEQATITLVFAIPAGVSPGVYTNTAHVSSPAPELSQANNTDEAPVTVVAQANLALSKWAVPDPAVPGEELTYYIVVTNTGPADAHNVTVSDTLPAGFQLSLVLASQGGCNGLPCNLGTLPAGGSATLQIMGTVASSVSGSGALANTAQVTSTTPGSSGSAVVNPALVTEADLGVVKSGTATAAPGDTVTYTVQLHNSGPADAQGVVVTDTLPAGLSLVAVTPGGICTGSGSTIVCSFGTLAAGATETVLVTATVASDVAPGSSLENRVTVGSSTPDPNPLNDSDSADTSIIAQADLIITKEQLAPAGAVVAGELVTYVIVITNTGPGLARSVDVKDELPVGMSLVDIQASGGGICGGTVCQFGTLMAGENRVITVTARVGSDVLAAGLVNVAGVFTPDDPDDPVANSAAVTTTVTQQADITVNKVALYEPVAPGGGQLYELVVTNLGPSDAQNVVVTDTLPAGVSWSGGSSGCSLVGSEAVCTVGTLAAGASRSFLIAVTVSQAAEAGSILTNTVTAQSSTPDPSPANTATVTSTVQGVGTQADLAITKLTGQGSVTAGETITYTLVVTNLGPSAATNVEVLELVPAGTQVLSLVAHNPDASNEFCSLGGACHLGTLFSGTTALVTVTLAVDASYQGATLTNSAHVSADQQDPDTSNNLTDVSTPVSRAADLSVAKRDLPDPVRIGETLLYQIVVSNTGPSTAYGVMITDTLDANLDYVGSSPGCSESGGVVTCHLGTLLPGAVRTVLVEGRVDASLTTTTTLNNSVAVGSSTPDPNGANNSASEQTVAAGSDLAATDLAIAKAATPSTVVAGEQVTFTLTITNLGPAAASNVQVVDALPLEGVVLEAISASQGTCNAGVTCLLGDLAVNGTATVVLVARVRGDQTTPLLNVARVASSNPDSNPDNNQASAGVTVTVDDDLRVLKLGPATVTPNQGIAYQIVVSNTGPSHATGVVVSDPLPAGIINAYASSSQGSCSVSSGTVTCVVGTLASGASALILVNGTVAAAATGDLVNVATATSQADPVGVSSTATTTVQTVADLALDVTSTPTVYAGETVLVTYTVTNNGPSVAEGAVVTATFPPEVSAPAGWTPVGGGIYTRSLGNVPAGAQVVITALVTTVTTVEPGTSIQFDGQVGSLTGDSNLANNQDNADTTVLALADLAVSKTGPVTATAGSLLTFTLVVTNLGPSQAQGVEIQDALPTGLVYQSATVTRTGSGLSSCVAGICQVGAVAVGEQVTVTLVARADADLAPGTVLTNGVTVFSDSTDPVADNNVASHPVIVATQVDLRVTKVALNSPVNAGEVLFYEIEVVNQGPSLARDVALTDTLPVSVTFAGASEGCSVSGSLVTCAVGDLNPGASATYLLQVRVDEEAADGLELLNQVLVAASGGITATDSVTATVRQPAGGAVDLAVAKSGPATALAGNVLAYTILITNHGPAVASSVQLVDALPNGVTVMSVSTSQGTCNAGITCDLGDLAAGGTITLGVSVLVAGDVTGNLVNTAQVSSNNTDVNPDNNTSSTTTTVTAQASLYLDKSVTPPVADPGGLVFYHIVVTNTGPSTARNVVVTDVLPAELQNPSVSSSVGGCSGFPCSLGDLAAGGSATIQVVGTLASWATGLVTNTASVTTTTPLANPGDDQVDSAVVAVSALADLVLTKADWPDPATAGETLLYTLTVTNRGPTPAEQVVVTDSLPFGTSFRSASNACSETAPGSGVVVCVATTDPLPVNATQVFTILVDVAADAPLALSLVNQAEVDSSTPDPDPDNNVAEADTEVLAVAALSVTKASAPNPVIAGELLTYTIVITNHGPSSATDVRVIDTIPDRTSLVSVTASNGGVCDSGIICLLGTLAVNEVVTVTIVVDVDADLRAGYVFTNTASVLSEQLDPPVPIQASTATTVAEVVDLKVTKQDFPDPATIGGTIRYQLLVENAGPSDAFDVVITDTLDSNTTFVQATLGFNCTSSGSVVTCTIPSLPAGSSQLIEIIASVNSGLPDNLVVTNTVTVTSGSIELNTLDNQDVATTTVRSGTDLSVSKSGPEQVIAGTTLTYTVVVNNLGPSEALNVTLTDTLPSAIVTGSLAVTVSNGASCT
ncbi:hypothetical protein RY27_16660, partial [Litorilinea aerophila]